MNDDAPPDEFEYRRLAAKARAETQAVLDQYRAAGMGDSEVARDLEKLLAEPIPPLSELKELPPITHEQYFELADLQAHQSGELLDLLIATEPARHTARELQRSNEAREADAKQRRKQWAQLAQAIWAENDRLSVSAVAARIALVTGDSPNTIRLHLRHPGR